MPPRAIPVRSALFVLLAVNAGIYATAGRASEGLDALAWFALLALFGIETRWPQWTRARHHTVLLALLRLAAATGVAIAALAYLREGAGLDAANAWLWIGVVAMLELEVRVPVLVSRYRGTMTAVSFALYGALVGIALTWLVQGEWFDAYDAMLWIAAFALIEMDLFRLAGDIQS